MTLLRHVLWWGDIASGAALQASPKARERGALCKCGPKTPPPTPLTADYRFMAVQARPHIAHIGPDTRCGMRAATNVARVAAAPPTLRTVGMVVVSGGQARGGGNGKRGGGRLVGG